MSRNIKFNHRWLHSGVDSLVRTDSVAAMECVATGTGQQNDYYGSIIRQSRKQQREERREAEKAAAAAFMIFIIHLSVYGSKLIFDTPSSLK